VSVCEDSVSISGVNFMKAACEQTEVFLCSLPEVQTAAQLSQQCPRYVSLWTTSVACVQWCVVRQLAVVAKFETCIWICVIKTNKMHSSLLICLNNYPLRNTNL